MFQLFKYPNTGQYMEFCTGWYRGLCDSEILVTYDLYNMDVLTKHTLGIHNN